MDLLPGRGQGFFDDRNPRSLSLPQQPVQPPSSNGAADFVPTADGQVIAFDPETLTSLGVVFAPPPGLGVVALEGLPNGSLVVAEQNGGVEMLRSEAEGQFQPVEAFGSLDGTPESPSALQVVETPSGQQVLVTSAGLDKIFVFTVLSPEPSAVRLPPMIVLETQPSSLVVSTSAPREAPLVLVATLVADTLSAESIRVSPAGALEGENAGESPALLVQASPQTQVAGEGGEAPLAAGLAAAGQPGPAAGPAEPGVDGGPPEVDLYRPTEVPRPMPSLSRRSVPAAPWVSDRVFAALGAVRPGSGDGERAPGLANA